MKLIERYIFRRMAVTLVLSFLALAAMLWLSQALRQFDLVTQQGQNFGTFLTLSAFLLPVLIMVVLPLSVLLSVTVTMTTLNGDSELAVMNASGMRQFALLKPALLIGLISTLLLAAMTLYFTPLSLRQGQVLLTQVRSSIVSSIAREGRFISLTPGLTFQLQNRQADGSLKGIFVSDDRAADKTMTYLAEKGAIIDNPLGVFLVMANGTIQQRSKLDGAISIIEFSSYAFDLSTFTSGAAAPVLTPRQQSTAYLLSPDPDDPYFRGDPGEFAAEFHDRVTSPLYGFLFAVLPLLFLGQAQSTRTSLAPSVAMASIALILVRTVGFFLRYAAAQSLVATVALYALPIGLTLLSVALVLRGVQIRAPERLIAAGERVAAWASGLWRRRAVARDAPA
jgi:lipopolysaccharide export system permease protein